MLGINVGRYGAGYHDLQTVTVTTINSLKALIANNDISGNNTVIIDECHHTKSNTIFDNIFDIPGRFRFAMSGTPLVLDDLSDLKLIGAAGPIIYEVSNEYLIKSAYSAVPVIKFIEIEYPDLMDNDDMKWADVYKQCITDNDYRNDIIIRLARQEVNRGPVLIMANWVRHVKNIYIPEAVYATGSDSKDDIQSKLIRFGSGAVPIMVCSPVFGEGVDIPDISTIIMAGGGKSHIQLLQRVGRGLRRGMSEYLHVYDFLDFTHNYVAEHSQERYDIYKSEGFTMELIE
jgi:superfamily II DNA or RNA helicase